MNTGTKALWFFTLLLLCVGIAGIVASIVGDSWWDSGNNNRQGLWRECKNSEGCNNRENILKFEEQFRDRDAILIVLIVSGAVSVFAVINLLCLCCCRKSEDGWKCGSLILTLLSFSGGIAGLGAMIYSEVQFKDKWDEDDHGWSVIFGWIGACLLAIAFVLSFVLICNGPDEDDYNRELVKSHNNRAYELS